MVCVTIPDVAATRTWNQSEASLSSQGITTFAQHQWQRHHHQPPEESGAISAMMHRTLVISILAIRRDGARIVPHHPIAASVASPMIGVLLAIAFPLFGDSPSCACDSGLAAVVTTRCLHPGVCKGHHRLQLPLHFACCNVFNDPTNDRAWETITF
jgi:hypothetical protein